jgi:hypothetical protein
MGAREGGRSPNPEISTKTFYPTLHQSKPIAEKANTICYIEFFTQNFFLDNFIANYGQRSKGEICDKNAKSSMAAQQRKWD